MVVTVDNCYGEFTEDREPCAVGADLCMGSLIKNPGEWFCLAEARRGLTSVCSCSPLLSSDDLTAAHLCTHTLNFHLIATRSLLFNRRWHHRSRRWLRGRHSCIDRSSGRQASCPWYRSRCWLHSWHYAAHVVSRCVSVAKLSAMRLFVLRNGRCDVNRVCLVALRAGVRL